MNLPLLRFLISYDSSYSHFYKEYIGRLKPLNTQQFLLFLEKSAYNEIALAYQGIYNRCATPENEAKLIKEYLEELVNIRTLQLWFTNFNYAQVEKVIIDLPNFEKRFHKKIEKGTVLSKVIHAHSFFELFLEGHYTLQSALIEQAFLIYGKEARENIMFSLEIIGE